MVYHPGERHKICHDLAAQVLEAERSIDLLRTGPLRLLDEVRTLAELQELLPLAELQDEDAVVEELVVRAESSEHDPLRLPSSTGASGVCTFKWPVGDFSRCGQDVDSSCFIGTLGGRRCRLRASLDWRASANPFMIRSVRFFIPLFVCQLLRVPRQSDASCCVNLRNWAVVSDVQSLIWLIRSFLEGAPCIIDCCANRLSSSLRILTAGLSPGGPFVL